MTTVDCPQAGDLTTSWWRMLLTVTVLSLDVLAGSAGMCTMYTLHIHYYAVLEIPVNRIVEYLAHE